MIEMIGKKGSKKDMSLAQLYAMGLCEIFGQKDYKESCVFVNCVFVNCKKDKKS
jgi:hypothetical protein